jgi:hypothetical protein
MLEIDNRTPFLAGISPWMDKHGVDGASIAVKGTFDIVSGATALPVSSAQVPLWTGDQHWGEPATSSIHYVSDLSPAKMGTDVALLGHAYAKRGRARVSDVALQVGQLRKVVRVFGERRWVHVMLEWTPSDPPAEFERIPLVWERAFGGRDDSDPHQKKRDFDRRNPVGTGFSSSGSKARLEGLALPNLEDPRSPIKKWKDTPPPACFGFVCPQWMPRSRFSGTYDTAWEIARMPHLPSDYDERYHNAASPDLIATPHLVGGEKVLVVGASADGDLTFFLPKAKISVTVWMRGQKSVIDPVLDTVVIEPDDKRISLTWRASLPCPRRFLQIEAVVVDLRTLP